MKRILILASIVIAAARGSWAFYDQGSQVVVIEAGAGIPTSKVNLPATLTPSGDARIGNPSGAFGAEYLYYVTPRWAVGIDGNDSQSGDYTPLESLLGTQVTPTLSSKSTVILAVAKYSFRVEHAVMPYLMAGLGAHYSSRKLTGTPGVGFVWSDTGTNEERTLGESSGSSYALGVGAGLDIPMGDHFFFGAEWRYQYLGSVNYSTTPEGQALGVSDLKGSTSLFNLFARLGYKF